MQKVLFRLTCIAHPWLRMAPHLYNRVFLLTWPASMQIYWNKRKRLHKKKVQLPQDLFGTPTWPPFDCFGTPTWSPWRHVKTLYAKARQRGRQNACVWQTWQAYFVGVLWWSSPKLMFSNLLQKDLFRGGWSSAEKFFKQNYCHDCHPSCCVSRLL